MTRVMIVAVVIAIGIGCEHPRRDAAARCSPPATTSKTDDELARRYAECTRIQNAGNSIRGDCFIDLAALVVFEYVDEIQREPQLVLVSDRTVIAIVLVTGTDLRWQEPTGHLVAHIVEADHRDRLGEVRTFVDPAAMTKAWPVKVTRVAKGDDVEKTNLAALPATGERAWAVGEYVAQITPDHDLAVHRFANQRIVETWRFSR